MTVAVAAGQRRNRSSVLTAEEALIAGFLGPFVECVTSFAGTVGMARAGSAGQSRDAQGFMAAVFAEAMVHDEDVGDSAETGTDGGHNILWGGQKLSGMADFQKVNFMNWIMS